MKTENSIAFHSLTVCSYRKTTTSYIRDQQQFPGGHPCSFEYAAQHNELTIANRVSPGLSKNASYFVCGCFNTNKKHNNKKT